MQFGASGASGNHSQQHHQHSYRSSRSYAYRNQPVEGSFCQYSHRVCMQNKIEGYDYCIKHILEDSSSPYKQCNYISNKTGKRCINAAPRHERKEGFCAEHTRQTIKLRQKANRKRKPQDTPQMLLEDLAVSHNRGISGMSQELKRTRSLESLASRILGSQHEYASSSDSESEGGQVDQAWVGNNDSDAESVDSEQEDPLKHAGIYTTEEVALLTRDKLIRLQSLYIDQFKRLQHLLKEKRRKYLHNVRMDKEQYGSISSAKDDPHQKDAYDKLQALKRYHKRYGKEALLHRQSQERRKQISEGANYRPPSYPKCIFFLKLTGSKCGERTVPLTKYCLQHILRDKDQVLFRACEFSTDGNQSCQQPVPALQDEESRCTLHLPLHPFEHRMPKRQSSEESNQSSTKDIEKVTKPDIDLIPILVQGQYEKKTETTDSRNCENCSREEDFQFSQGTDFLKMPVFTSLIAAGTSTAGGTLTSLLSAANYNIACAMEIINYSKWELNNPCVVVHGGKIKQPPNPVGPGIKEAMITHKTDYSIKGTYGTLTYDIDNNTDYKLVVMWSVPFSYTYSNWLAVGLMHKHSKCPKNQADLFRRMYYGQEDGFKRAEYNGCSTLLQFEDEHAMVLVRANMGTSHRTLVNVEILPINDLNLSTKGQFHV